MLAGDEVVDGDQRIGEPFVAAGPHLVELEDAPQHHLRIACGEEDGDEGGAQHQADHRHLQRQPQHQERRADQQQQDPRARKGQHLRQQQNRDDQVAAEHDHFDDGGDPQELRQDGRFKKELGIWLVIGGAPGHRTEIGKVLENELDRGDLVEIDPVFRADGQLHDVLEEFDGGEDEHQIDEQLHAPVVGVFRNPVLEAERQVQEQDLQQRGCGEGLPERDVGDDREHREAAVEGHPHDVEAQVSRQDHHADAAPEGEEDRFGDLIPHGQAELLHEQQDQQLEGEEPIDHAVRVRGLCAGHCVGSGERGAGGQAVGLSQTFAGSPEPHGWVASVVCTRPTRTKRSPSHMQEPYSFVSSGE